jgi:hypothetical protein
MSSVVPPFSIPVGSDVHRVKTRAIHAYINTTQSVIPLPPPCSTDAYRELVCVLS